MPQACRTRAAVPSWGGSLVGAAGLALGLAAVAAAAVVLVLMLSRAAVSAFAVAGGALALAGSAERAAAPKAGRKNVDARARREAFFRANAPGLGARPPLSLGPGRRLLAYNVHAFADLWGRGTRNEIGELLAAWSPSVDAIALFEVSGSRAALAEVLRGLGFPHFLAVSNGVADDSLALAVATRAPGGAAAVDTMAPPGGGDFGVQRQQVLFSVGGLRGAAVHLEIGARPGRRPEDAAADAETCARNSAFRCAQLELVLAHSPDFLVGDFNFTLSDPERWFLAGRGFVPVNDDRHNTTPFNRVDHFFVREGLASSFPPASNELIRCNYSDHLPVLQTLP